MAVKLIKHHSGADCPACNAYKDAGLKVSPEPFNAKVGKMMEEMLGAIPLVPEVPVVVKEMQQQKKLIKVWVAADLNTAVSIETGMGPNSFSWCIQYNAATVLPANDFLESKDKLLLFSDDPIPNFADKVGQALSVLKTKFEVQMMNEVTPTDKSSFILEVHYSPDAATHKICSTGCLPDKAKFNSSPYLSPVGTVETFLSSYANRVLQVSGQYNYETDTSQEVVAVKIVAILRERGYKVNFVQHEKVKPMTDGLIIIHTGLPATIEKLGIKPTGPAFEANITAPMAKDYNPNSDINNPNDSLIKSTIVNTKPNYTTIHNLNSAIVAAQYSIKDLVVVITTKEEEQILPHFAKQLLDMVTWQVKGHKFKIWNHEQNEISEFNGSTRTDYFVEDNGEIVKVEAMKNLRTISLSVPRTQKVMGIVALGKENVFSSFIPEAYVVQSQEELKYLKLPWKKTFARPAPTRPRHGFVESRIVTSKAELNTVYKEAIAADRDAEVILMPLINAIGSAILVNESGALSVGPGHDGATGGKDSILIPVTATTIDGLRKNATIKKDEHTYIETVFQNFKKMYVVQARGGPPVPLGSTDWVPSKLTVTKVLVPTDDLLAWEKLVEDHAGKKGVVAWQRGATLACHAAVHCVMNGIPFLTGENPPHVGDTLEPTTSGKTFWSNDDFLRGFRLSETVPLATLQDTNTHNTILTVLHNSVAMRNAEQWPVFLGFAAGMAVKLGSLACLGELRHYSYTTRGERGSIWEKHGSKSNYQLARMIGARVPRFIHDGKWRSGFGGWSWARCGIQTIRLYQACVKMDEKEIVAGINRIVNTSHNGGLFLNKFIEQGEFDLAAQTPGFFALKNAMALYVIAANSKIMPASRLMEYEPFSRKWVIQPEATSSTGYVRLKLGKTLITPVNWNDTNKETVKQLIEDV